MWQLIGNQIDASLILARSDFANVLHWLWFYRIESIYSTVSENIHAGCAAGHVNGIEYIIFDGQTLRDIALLKLHAGTALVFFSPRLQRVIHLRHS